MRKALVILAALLLAGSAHALGLNVMTIPVVLTPGTSGKMVFYITATGPVQNMDLKVEDNPLSVEEEGDWIDLGDASGGTVSYTLGFSVPSTLNPGTYVIPIIIRYDDVSTGKTFEEHFSKIVEVTSGSGLEFEVPERVSAGKEQSVRITISNTGPTISDLRITVPGALGQQTTYVGTLESGESRDIYVKILPACQNGIYEFNILATGFQGTEALNRTYTYVVKCVLPQQDLQVDMEMPDKIVGGEQNTILTIRNNLDIATGPIAIEITGINVEIGGKSAYFYTSIAPRETLKIPVIWRLVKSDEPGTINVKITTDYGQRFYSFSVVPDTSPLLQVYPAGDAKWEGDALKLGIAVANIGTGTAESVFVSAEGNGVVSGNYVIGDLAPGDYDTATVMVRPRGEEVELNVEITYLVNGKRVNEYHTLRYPVPGKSQGSWTWILIVAAIAGGIWYWRKRK